MDGYLTGAATAAPERIVRDYLTAHADLYGNTESLRLVRSYTSRDRVRKLIFEQRAGGVPVLDGELVANVTTDGRLVNVLGAPRPDVRTPPPPVLDATASGSRRPAAADDAARLVLADGRLAWRSSRRPRGPDRRARRAHAAAAEPRASRASADLRQLPGRFLGGTQRQVDLGA